LTRQRFPGAGEALVARHRPIHRRQRIGQTPRESLECDLAAEHEARALYKEARDYCKEVGDYVSMKMFEEVMADEEGHIDFLETQLDLHDKLGAERYALLNASKADEAE
jgi:bacterioferritin